MAKAIFRGLAKPDNPIFSQPVYFATPLLLRDLDDEIEKFKLEQEQEAGSSADNKEKSENN